MNKRIKISPKLIAFLLVGTTLSLGGYKSAQNHEQKIENEIKTIVEENNIDKIDNIDNIDNQNILTSIGIPEHLLDNTDLKSMIEEVSSHHYLKSSNINGIPCITIYDDPEMVQENICGNITYSDNSIIYANCSYESIKYDSLYKEYSFTFNDDNSTDTYIVTSIYTNKNGNKEDMYTTLEINHNIESQAIIHTENNFGESIGISNKNNEKSLVVIEGENTKTYPLDDTKYNEISDEISTYCNRGNINECSNYLVDIVNSMNINNIKYSKSL